jgi:hypothetical protein
MTPSDTDAAVGLAITFTLVGGLVGVALYVWYGLALSKVFAKLGADPWRGWVPILNEMEILSRGGVPAWSVVYYFIPVVNLYGLYLKITAVHRINEQLGRGVGSTALGILLPPVWASLLAWGATPPVAGVGGTRVASMLGNGPASGTTSGSAVATGPLGRPAAQSAPSAPFAQVASDPSGYALPGVQPVVVPPAPAFSPPPAAESTSSVRPAQSTEADAAPVTSAPANGLIVNPWAQQAAVAETPAVSVSPAPVTSEPPAISSPPIISAPPVIPVAPVIDEVEAPESADALGGHPPVGSVSGTLDDGDGDDDDDDELDRTVVVDRRPVIPWRLRTDDGFEVALTASKIVLGRNPVSSEVDVEAIAVPDSTRTLSKTHARLELVDGVWTVTDLNSTNGVLVVGEDESESLIPVNVATALRSRFVLGKVGMAVNYEMPS